MAYQRIQKVALDPAVQVLLSDPTKLMPSSTSLSRLPQFLANIFQCHMFSLLFSGPESPSNIGNCDMDYRDNAILQAQSWRVDLFKDFIDRSFAFLLQLCFQNCQSSRWFGCYHGWGSMRAAADLHPLFRCVFQIQRTLSLAAPFPNWFCKSNWF